MAFEGLQQFGASQIHLAANNLGICYLMDDNYIEAIKYLTLSDRKSTRLNSSHLVISDNSLLFVYQQTMLDCLLYTSDIWSFVYENRSKIMNWFGRIERMGLEFDKVSKEFSSFRAVDCVNYTCLLYTSRCV